MDQRLFFLNSKHVTIYIVLTLLTIRRLILTLLRIQYNIILTGTIYHAKLTLQGYLFTYLIYYYYFINSALQISLLQQPTKLHITTVADEVRGEPNEIFHSL